MAGIPEQEHYRQVAAEEVMSMQSTTFGGLANVVVAAADGAVAADRARMAEQLRSRILFNQGSRGLTSSVDMQVDEIMFDLADQIEHGMPVGLSGTSPDPNSDN